MLSIVRLLRFILCVELLAFYTTAPATLLLVLDSQHGLIDEQATSAYRMLMYMLFIGGYPFLQMMIAPHIGKRLDTHPKKTILQTIHFTNAIGYTLLALGSYTKYLSVALLGCILPALMGAIMPAIKTFIAILTDKNFRLHEFAKLAIVRGLATFLGPFLGIMILWLDGATYTTIFIFSACLSLTALCLTWLFIPFSYETYSPDLSLFETSSLTISSFFKSNSYYLTIFFCLFTGYCVFIRFIPVVLLKHFTKDIFIINYFSALVGLSMIVNQVALAQFLKLNDRYLMICFGILCSSLLYLCFSFVHSLTFFLLLAILFCFSILTTHIESRLSIQGITSTQGKLQGILYSLENSGYVAGPILGALLASYHPIYAIYFVLLSGLIGATLFSKFCWTYLSKAEKV